MNAALQYQKRGWTPLIYARGRKAPREKSWPTRVYTEAELEAACTKPHNVGVILGERSGGLVDIDLDCGEAVRQAGAFLPGTDAVFGRASKPRSHWLYGCTPCPKSTTFKDTDGSTLLEVRADGRQTMFPPSEHPSGEDVRWDREGEPGQVDAAALVTAAGELAAAALLVRHWPQEGSRQDVALALAGGLLRGGWDADRAGFFITKVAEAAGDDEAVKRASAVEYTAARLRDGRTIQGWPSLVKVVGDEAVDRVRLWLDLRHEADDGEVPASSGSVLDTRWPERTPLDYFTVAPPRRAWLLTQPNGLGVIPRGKVGLLAAEGGCGKTSALLALAVSLATGRPWFGQFMVPDDLGGRILLLLGEEDEAEIHRRLYGIAEGLRLSQREREACAARITAVPLAGVPVSLTEATGAPTPLVAELCNRLASDEWALIALDPLSRFAGPDTEVDNTLATRFVQVCEQVTEARGHPAVIVAAHSSKQSRRQGSVDLRGATGLGDAARLVMTLRRDRDIVLFGVSKSNYGLPLEPVRLTWSEGVLRVLTFDEREAAARAADVGAADEVEADIARVLGALSREGALTSRDSIARAAGLRATRGRAALDLAVGRGLVRTGGTAKRPTYAVAVPMEGGESPPHTPPSVRDGRTAYAGPVPAGIADGWDGLGRVGRDSGTRAQAEGAG